MASPNTILLLFFLLALVGCGGGAPADMPELGEVSGVIKVDGEPQANILVSFQPEQGRPSMGVTDENGEYTLKYTQAESGAKVGKNLVTISTKPPEESSTEGCGCSEDEGFLDPIHPKYNTEAIDNPEMTVEVKLGSQEFNFDVTTDPSARTSGSRQRAPRCCCE